MPRVTIDNTDSGNDLDAFYHRTLAYLYQKYHVYPDNLPQIPMSARTATDLQAWQVGAEQQFVNNMSRDERYSNGLPRRTPGRWGG